MIKGDKLLCKVCLNEYFNDYPEWQGLNFQNCPVCMHNGYWNLSEIDRMGEVRKHAWIKKIYKFGDYKHKEHVGHPNNKGLAKTIPEIGNRTTQKYQDQKL